MSRIFETLADTVPESIGRDAGVKACIKGIDPYLRAFAEARDIPALYFRLADLSSAQMDHLARQMDVDVWRDNWDATKKRTVLLASYDVKRHAGTVGAVRTILRSLGATVLLKEWWELSPKGTPHTFTLTAIASPASGNSTLTDEEQEDLVRAIDRAKPVRSHYELVIATAHTGGINISGNYRHAVQARLHNL